MSASTIGGKHPIYWEDIKDFFKNTALALIVIVWIVGMVFLPLPKFRAVWLVFWPMIMGFPILCLSERN